MGRGSSSGAPAGGGIGLKDPDTWTFFDKLSFSWMNKWVAES